MAAYWQMKAEATQLDLLPAHCKLQRGQVQRGIRTFPGLSKQGLPSGLHRSSIPNYQAKVQMAMDLAEPPVGTDGSSLPVCGGSRNHRLSLTKPAGSSWAGAATGLAQQRGSPEILSPSRGRVHSVLLCMTPLPFLPSFLSSHAPST